MTAPAHALLDAAPSRAPRPPASEGAKSRTARHLAMRNILRVGPTRYATAGQPAIPIEEGNTQYFAHWPRARLLFRDQEISVRALRRCVER